VHQAVPQPEAYCRSKWCSALHRQSTPDAVQSRYTMCCHLYTNRLEDEKEGKLISVVYGTAYASVEYMSVCRAGCWGIMAEARNTS